MPGSHQLLTRLNNIISQLIELPLKMRAEWLESILERHENRDLLIALKEKDPSFQAKLAESKSEGLTILLYKKMLVLPVRYMQPVLTISEMLAETEAALEKKYNRSTRKSPRLTAPASDKKDESFITKTIQNILAPGERKEVTFYPISTLPTLFTTEQMCPSGEAGVI